MAFPITYWALSVGGSLTLLENVEPSLSRSGLDSAWVSDALKTKAKLSYLPLAEIQDSSLSGTVHVRCYALISHAPETQPQALKYQNRS